MQTDTLDAVETGSHMHPDVNAVDAAIRSRKAVRVFRPDAVSRKDVADILDVARHAPSNSNTQPWHVHVLTGRAKQRFSEVLHQAFLSVDHPPLQHMPDPLPGVCLPRQEDFGARYYGALGVDKTDVAARMRATGRNFSFFGAPVGLIYTVDSCLKKYSWLDYGMFLQTVMVAARARGFHTCAQVSFARYQTVIAEHLHLTRGFEVVCGMSLGYADETSIVNHLRMPRESVEKFSRFMGFED
jgi:nitroreductase